MAEPISRSDVTAKAMEAIEWLETFDHDSKQYPNDRARSRAALQVIFYLDKVNTSLESRLAEIAHMAVQPVLLAAPEKPDGVTTNHGDVPDP